MDNYEKITKNRPHVVILGAGASKAALPEGDKYHKPISCMENFFQNLKMDDLINNLNLETKSSNLEKIFSEIEEKSKTNIEFLNAKNKLKIQFLIILIPIQYLMNQQYMIFYYFTNNSLSLFY